MMTEIQATNEIDYEIIQDRSQLYIELVIELVLLSTLSCRVHGKHSIFELPSSLFQLVCQVMDVPVAEFGDQSSLLRNPRQQRSSGLHPDVEFGVVVRKDLKLYDSNQQMIIRHQSTCTFSAQESQSDYNRDNRYAVRAAQADSWVRVSTNNRLRVVFNNGYSSNALCSTNIPHLIDLSSHNVRGENGEEVIHDSSY